MQRSVDDMAILGVLITALASIIVYLIARIARGKD